jgi:hypothetical protein
MAALLIGRWVTRPLMKLCFIRCVTLLLKLPRSVAGTIVRMVGGELNLLNSLWDKVFVILSLFSFLDLRSCLEPQCIRE